MGWDVEGPAECPDGFGGGVSGPVGVDVPVHGADGDAGCGGELVDAVNVFAFQDLRQGAAVPCKPASFVTHDTKG
jgi:hypothetical protein